MSTLGAALGLDFLNTAAKLSRAAALPCSKGQMARLHHCAGAVHAGHPRPSDGYTECTCRIWSTPTRCAAPASANLRGPVPHPARRWFYLGAHRRSAGDQYRNGAGRRPSATADALLRAPIASARKPVRRARPRGMILSTNSTRWKWSDRCATGSRVCRGSADRSRREPSWKSSACPTAPSCCALGDMGFGACKTDLQVWLPAQEHLRKSPAARIWATLGPP